MNGNEWVDGRSDRSGPIPTNERRSRVRRLFPVALLVFVLLAFVGCRVALNQASRSVLPGGNGLVPNDEHLLTDMVCELNGRLPEVSGTLHSAADGERSFLITVEVYDGTIERASASFPVDLARGEGYEFSGIAANPSFEPIDPDDMTCLFSVYYSD